MENTKMVALIGNREIRFSILKEKLGYQRCRERMIDHADIVVVFDRHVSSDTDGVR